MLDLVWLSPAFPLFGFVVLVLAGRKLGEPKAGLFATAMCAAAFVVTAILFFDLLSKSGESEEVLTLLAKLLATFEIELAPEMGGRDGIRKRESTHLTLQTAGTKGIRCRLTPRSPAIVAATAEAPAFPLKSDKSVSPFDLTANCL